MHFVMNNIESSPDPILRMDVDELYHANSENLVVLASFSTNVLTSCLLLQIIPLVFCRCLHGISDDEQLNSVLETDLAIQSGVLYTV